MLAAFVAVLGLAGLAMALLATRGAVSGEEGPINARAEAKVPVEVALAKPEPALPEGMPTSKPKTKRAALDPLSGEEVGYARGLALKAAGEGTGERVDGTPGLQFLSVDLAENDKARAVTINSYDYASDELVTQVVDVASGKVETTRAKGVQPPPSKREVDTAMTRLLASRTARRSRTTTRATPASGSRARTSSTTRAAPGPPTSQALEQRSAGSTAACSSRSVHRTGAGSSWSTRSSTSRQHDRGGQAMMRRIPVALAVAFVLGGTSSASAQTTTPTAGFCTGETLISHTLKNGAKWEMCWGTHR